MREASEAISTPHGDIIFPSFLPDGTRGVVKSVDSADLLGSGIKAVQMNVFHLMQDPGSTTIQSLGGLHAMSGWNRPISTDSGGFQIYSMIRQNPRLGTITSSGAIFKPSGSSRKFQLTPEKSIQLQFSYGADILFCLDDCTHVDDPREEQEDSVNRTISWAQKGKQEFLKLVEEKNLSGEKTPCLFAVIQGGNSKSLREKCAEALQKIGFDGYGYGGFPLDSEGNLVTEIISFTRELVPRSVPMHALGFGHPETVSIAYDIGYDLFDSSLPTRDARQGRLYIFEQDPHQEKFGNNWYSFLYIKDKKHVKRNAPLSKYCDCHACKHYSVGYLHHLFNQQDALFERLATIHNLWFMAAMMDNFRTYRQG